MNHISNNFVANPTAISTQNPISTPKYNVNDYVKHVYTKGKFGVVINVDPMRFSYFSSTLPAYLVGWEDGDESWVSGGSIRECTGQFNVKEIV